MRALRPPEHEITPQAGNDPFRKDRHRYGREADQQADIDFTCRYPPGIA